MSVKSSWMMALKAESIGMISLIPSAMLPNLPVSSDQMSIL